MSFAKARAEEAIRRDVESTRERLQAPFTKSEQDEQREAWRVELASALGIDEHDRRLDQVTERMMRSELEARAELRRLMAEPSPNWDAALQVVAGLYREQNVASILAFGGAATEDVRLAFLDQRAAMIATMAALAGLPWDQYDEITPPAFRP